MEVVFIDMVNLVDSPVCFEIQGMDSLGVH
jgi:hypothetical protein